MRRQHAYRIPVWTLQLGLMILSAAIVLAGLWLGLALLLSLREYIPAEVLR